MAERLGELRRVGVGLLIAGLLSGCSLVNPHVTWKAPPCATPSAAMQSSAAAPAPQGPPPYPCGSLDYAVEYADTAKSAYQSALGTQSTFSSLLGIGLLALGASALGLGITGGSTAAITALSLAGASGYVTGLWLTGKPQQKAYVAGYNATSCAVDAVLPLRYVVANAPSIRDTRTLLYARIAAVESSVQTLKALIPTAPATALRDEANEQVTAAETLLSASYQTATKATQTLQDAATVGPNLKETVDRISGQVAQAIVETGPDLTMLASLVSSLSQAYGQFVRVPEGLKPAAVPRAEGVAEDEPLRAALNTLEGSIRELRQTNRELADTINVVAGSKPVEKLKGCGVNIDALVTPLAVEPAGDIRASEKTAGTFPRTITGGSPPYWVDVAGTGATGLTARATEPFASTFLVQTTAETPAGDYAVSVADKAGHRLFVMVHVESKSQTRGALPPRAGADPTAQALAQAATGIAPGVTATVGEWTIAVTKSTLHETEKKLDVEVGVKSRSGVAPTSAQLQAIPDEQIAKALLASAGIAGLSPTHLHITKRPAGP